MAGKFTLTSNTSTHDLYRAEIDYAMKNGSALWIDYCNNQGNCHTRVVEPRQWENSRVFRAYCHFRKEDRSFKVGNIRTLKRFPSVTSALAYQETPPESPPAKPAANPIPSHMPQRISDHQPTFTPPIRSTASQSTSHVTKELSNPQSSPIQPPVLTRITSSENWRCLVTYYAECLIRENRQQYILKPEWLRTFPSSLEDVQRFMLGEIQLVFSAGDPLQQDVVARFIESNSRKPDKKLCLGYPFLVIQQNEIAPIIYTPVEIMANHDTYTLRSEGYEVSYAALKSLRLSEEEIDAFIEECDGVRPSAEESLIQALENLLFSKIAEIYRTDLPRTRDMSRPGTIFDAPALFWVSDNIATTNLIHELHELADPSCWEKSPHPLRQLLNVLPDHEYPSLQPWEQDTGIYVTSLNDQQLRAVHSVRSEPVIVVTGPPGTGKSQLVLNLIADAFLRGEKVLFASRNNRAVDVVMDRLQSEFQFQGAVRTGNTQNRERAAAQMKAALDEVGATGPRQTLEPTKERYFVARQNALKAQDELDQVRRLSGLLLSHNQEREQYLGFLPKGLRKISEETVPTYRAEEADRLQSTFSSFREQALKLEEEKLQLAKRLTQIETEGGTDYPLVSEIHRLEDQWGEFAGGFIGSRHYETNVSLTAHVKSWLDLIDLVKHKAQLAVLSQQLSQLHDKLSETRNTIPQQLIGRDETIASICSWEEIDRFTDQSQRLKNRLERFSTGTASPWNRLLNWITGGALVRKEGRSLGLLHSQLDLPMPNLQDEGAEELGMRAGELGSLLASAALLQELTIARSEADVISQALLELEAVLPAPLSDDVNKLKGFGFDSSRLKTDLRNLQEQIETLQARTDELAEQVNRRLNSNEGQTSMLGELKKSRAGNDGLLWQLRIPAEPRALIQHLTKWHNLVSFWGADASSRHVKDLLASLPSEKEALTKLENSQSQMLRLSSEIMRGIWLERAQQASNEVFQKACDYVAAVQELTRGYNAETYQKFKAMEKSNLGAAVQMFPIWASTNLTAKTNFPLTHGFFDLVIIDEASQCDFPSALPLLYRGGKMVIIGDPNQLKHVATLSRDADQELASRYGVGFDAFSYNAHSLYDIAQRSSGSHPGALLLNEHYRSDARIINFSNQEFYNNQLVIRTDLSQRNISKAFLNQFGGIFWLQVDGKVEYPPGGSLYNQDELMSIRDLLPRLVDELTKNELEHASIGIVTPYREQEDRIWEIVNGEYGNAGRITVGTAHKFQGDEKDFMIFSPVLAGEISEGSLRWLQRTRNLLNVAITRARIGLIIVGDWDFCSTLQEDHCFRHLADYVARQPERILRDVADLSLFGRPRMNIVGHVTDPHNPEYNRTTLRRFVSSCSEFVWWTDPYLNNHVLDLWWDVFQDPQVTIREVHLLTAKELTEPKDGKKPQLSVERYESMRSELVTRDIQLEIRLLPSRDLPHDRLFYSPGQAVNMPPFGSAYGDHHRVSEYTQSGTNRDFFTEHWRKALKVEQGIE